MLSLIKNEFIKIFKRPKTWIVFTLFIALVGINIFGTWKNDQTMREWISPEYQIKQAEEQLTYIRNDIKRAEADEDQNWLNSSKEIEKNLLNQIEDNKEIIKNGISEESWKKDLEQTIKDLEIKVESYEENGINEWNKRWYAQSKQELEDYKYLRDNNIMPLQG